MQIVTEYVNLDILTNHGIFRDAYDHKNDKSPIQNTFRFWKQIVTLDSRYLKICSKQTCLEPFVTTIKIRLNDYQKTE